MPALRSLLTAGLAGLATLAGAAAACAQDDFVSDAARLVTVLDLRPGQTVADIGAGGGQLAIELARALGPAGRVYATELSEGRRRDIREAAEEAGLTNIAVVEAHATRTNLPDRCCDALVLRRVYHHIEDPARMNASLLASLRPGGFLAILDFEPDGTESADPGGRDVGAQHGVTSATVLRELQQAGFERVEVEDGVGGDRYLLVVRRPVSPEARPGRP